MSHEATKQEVSSAYRKMALKYHPDRNPDPEAAQFFAESITKAYKALTGAELELIVWVNAMPCCPCTLPPECVATEHHTGSGCYASS